MLVKSMDKASRDLTLCAPETTLTKVGAGSISNDGVDFIKPRIGCRTIKVSDISNF